MKIVQINATCGQGSTGKICVAVSRLLNERNIENYILYTVGKSDFQHGIHHGERFPRLQALKSRLLGNYGFNSERSTQRLIRELDRIAPDVVHLHNLHAHNVHLGKLFSYFRKKKIRLFWTFHDCWAFTGYCPYFDLVKCDKWKTQCHRCPQKRQYSWLFDRSSALFQKKKKLFAELDLTVVTPSRWLGDLVKESFLSDYPVKVINNGIDLSIFTPRDSDFRQKYGLEDKFILLGVAFDWGKRKGLDVFCELSKRLDDSFKIVLVGTNDEIDKSLPASILSIHRTQNQRELAEIYSAADLFVNPTREENYPTVNMEAIACGTPVLTFKTGGSPEILDETCGRTVECDDVDGLLAEILSISQDKPFSVSACLDRAKAFDQNDKYLAYLNLYELRQDDES